MNLPCFCYHEKLTISGNCRVCLVEINGNVVTSCSLPLLNGMNVFTESSRVRRSREGIMKFLLINHPLDCPICDQGGECDLQDIALTFGLTRGNFYEIKKRSFDNLNVCGPLIKTMMTRCIHCGRCIRFLQEIAGVPFLGMLGRGKNMEVGTFIDTYLDHELSGNIIDLCPVGALTSMPYSFIARSWELVSVMSIDIFDSISASIRLDTIGNSVVRIVPFLDEVINEEWITNKTRFIYDSFTINRIVLPNLRIINKLIGISWSVGFNVFTKILNNFDFDFFYGFIGFFCDLDSAWSLKYFFNNIGCSNIGYLDYQFFCNDFRYNFLLKESLFFVTDLNIFLFLGVNLRTELPILTSRLRKFINKVYTSFFFSIGYAINYLNFPVLNLGNTLKVIINFFDITSLIYYYFFLFSFKSFFFFNINYSLYSKFSLFLGNFIFNSTNFLTFAFNKFKYNIKFFYKNLKSIYLSNFLGSLTALEVNIFPSKNDLTLNVSNKFFSNLIYLLGVDELNVINKNNFYIFHGYFFNTIFILNVVNLILPVFIFSESNLGFLNLEGRLRVSAKATTSFRNIFSIHKVIWSLLNIVLNTISSNNFSIISNFIFVMVFFSNLIFYLIIFNKKLEKFFNLLNLFLNDFYVILAPFFSGFFSFLFLTFLFNNFLILRNFAMIFNKDSFTSASKNLKLHELRVLKFLNSFSKYVL